MTDRNLSRNRLMPVLIIGGLFFVFGFVTWLNGSLIPFLQIACDLTHFQAYFVTLAFYISYTVMALPVSLVLRRVGYKNGLALGLVVMMMGALVFIPAALTREYGVFLIGLYALGTGLTLLQTAANPYIVLIGPAETAAVRISIMGLLNKGAGILAPLVFTALVLGDMSGFDVNALADLTPGERSHELDILSRRLISPYLVLAGLLAGLAVYIKLSPLPDPEFPGNKNESESAASVLRHPNLVLGAVALFFYMGAEVIAGDTIGLFGRELGVQNFTQLTAYTMAFMMCGYALGIIVIPRMISQESALAASAVLGCLLTVTIGLANPSSSSLWESLFGWLGVPAIPDAVFMVALLGLANALVWPAVWPLALRGLNQAQTGTGSALLIMGIAGGALIPLLFGALADLSSDPRAAYWLLLPCYLFVLHYAVFGHKKTRWGR
jgi:glucose/galactose transporter